MERRNHEEELARLCREMPLTACPSPSPSYLGNPSSFQSPSHRVIESTPASLASSSSSHPSSSFVSRVLPSFENNVSGAAVVNNPVVSNTLIGQGEGFLSLNCQEVQQMIIALEKWKLQEAIAAKIATTRRFSFQSSVPQNLASPRSNPISIVDEPIQRFNVDNTSVNGCWDCCRHHRLSSNGSSRLPRPSSQEYAKRSSMMLCSNKNEFRLDSNEHRRVAAGDDRFFDPSLNNPQRLQHTMYWSLEDWKGQIVALAKDQKGSRLLQEKVREGRVDEIEMIFAEVKDQVGELMIHPWGNYVVQSVFEFCAEEQKMDVLWMITKEEFQFVTICLDTHGTRVVQKMLEHLHTTEQISCAMMALRPGILLLAKNVNGYHVLQICLRLFTPEDNKYILMEVAKHCVEIATDSSGCALIQFCVANTQGETKGHLIAEIIANAIDLARDPFGNYVVQCILDLEMPHVVDAVLQQFKGNFISFSRQRISSHVVEKCLKVSTKEQSSKIITELLSSSEFVSLLEDAYGNYVVQSALLVAEGETYKAIAALVRSRSLSMRSNPYGRRILDKINAKR